MTPSIVSSAPARRRRHATPAGVSRTARTTRAARVRHGARATLIAAAIACHAAAPAQAQRGGRDAPGPNLQIVPKIGVVTPLNAISEEAEVSNGLGFGVAAELVVPRLPVNLRVNLDHAYTADIVMRNAAGTLVGTVEITNVVGDLVLRPLAANARFQPYFLGGGGVRFYSYDVTVAGPAGLTDAVNATRRATLHVGGGIDVRMGPLALLLELSDYVSTVPDDVGGTRLQNDLFGLLGFRVAMF
jgi:hypothetical protein